MTDGTTPKPDATNDRVGSSSFAKVPLVWCPDLLYRVADTLVAHEARRRRAADHKVSPDSKYIAEYRLYKHGGATSTDTKAVQVRTKLNPFRHTLVDALDYGADLSITWIDSRNLLITCPESGGKLDFYGKDTNWREISIHYDLDNCQIAGAIH